MNKYDEIKCIGRGAYGTAHLVVLRATGAKFVVKKIATELLTEKEKAQAFREVELLASLKHPNVVEYRESFVERNVIHIVMAYCDGGDLAEKIRDRASRLDDALAQVAHDTTQNTQQTQNKSVQKAYFEITQVLDWFVQMAMAIKYLHGQRVLHRDLKTSNIFLTTENVIKLGDFGIAKTLDSTLDQARTVVGTPYYMSPEVCENRPYSYASDVWSLGCVLYEMCTLRHAFDAPNIISLIFTIVRKEFAPVPSHFDANVSSLLQLLLDKAPENRPSMEQLFHIPYIRNHMEGLVASGGSLRVQPTSVRRPLATHNPNPNSNSNGLKRRVQPKDLSRKASDKSNKRTTFTPHTVGGSQQQSQWLPVAPLDVYELRRIDCCNGDSDVIDDDLELLDASCWYDNDNKAVRMPALLAPPPPHSLALLAPPPKQQLPRTSAWCNDNVDTVEEDDHHSRIEPVDAAELVSPNFEDAYSEECRDSRQIYYSSKGTNASSSKSRFRPSILVATPRVVMKQLQLEIDDDDTRTDSHTTTGSPAAVALSTEQSDRRVAAGYGDGDVVSEASGASLSYNSNVSADESDDASSSNSSESDAYDAEENFYSDDDDSDVYASDQEESEEEEATLYTDDFDDADAEVIEYVDVGNDLVDNTQAMPLQPTEVLWVMQTVAESLQQSQ